MARSTGRSLVRPPGLAPGKPEKDQSPFAGDRPASAPPATAADTFIHYDPWWNPAVEGQATDRAHRIGQDKPVFVYKLRTLGTVEEKIQELQARKRSLDDGLFETSGKKSASLDADDIATLFAPIDG